LAGAARTRGSKRRRRRALTIDARGFVAGAVQVPSPNCDARPAGTELSLIVVHGI
jgi:hypothetical protein